MTLSPEIRDAFYHLLPYCGTSDDFRVIDKRFPGTGRGTSLSCFIGQVPLHKTAESTEADGFIEFQRRFVERPHIRLDTGKAPDLDVCS